MRVARSHVFFLVLAISLGNVADSKKKNKNKGSCPVQPEESGSSIVAEAGSTGSIHFQPVNFFQYFDTECHSEETREYRTADGTCNHVYNLGAANTPFKRLLPPAYGDLINSPRAYGKDGSPLPSPADVSRKIHSHENKPSSRPFIFMQWGQFVDHDITLTPVPTESGKSIECCGSNRTYPNGKLNNVHCFPIKLSEEDKRFIGDCMEFVRSLPAREPTGFQRVPREQVNELTSFLDGSMIYGSSEELQHQLRETNSKDEPGAKMKMSEKGLLPKTENENCILKPNQHCFLSGDERVNVQPCLIAMHTMWSRLHNDVVDGLQPVQQNASDEELFQEARKIVVGILQNVHFNEWLPLVLGGEMHGRYRLFTDPKKGKRFGYSGHVDPRISNAFASAAFRFGHSLIPEFVNVSGTKHMMRDLFFRPFLVHEDFDGVVEALLNPDFSSHAQSINGHLVDEITGHLFESETQERDSPSHGLDLAALNIQRGRDHGLPPFNKYREYCGLQPITNFTEFGESADSLSLLYKSVGDIDLFTGGLLEKPVSWGIVGPTFGCIIAQQFQALKFGDRFYFETDQMREGFTDDQLEAIHGMTLAHVCCQTSKIEKATKEVFKGRSPTVKCEDLRDKFLNFTLWTKT